MHDVIFGEDLEGFDHLTKIDKGPFLRERPFLLHELIKRSTSAKFIDKVKVVNSLQHVNIPDEIRAILDCRQNVNLIDCKFFQFRNLLEFLCINDLDRHLLFCFHVNSLVNFTVDSLTQLLKNCKVFDDLAHPTLRKEEEFKIDIKKLE